jgi:alpha-2-macroglobulin
MKKAFVALVLLFVAATARSAETLRVINAGPSGEIAAREEANEVRVVFSEPMVVLGRIPNPVTAPWFRIAPAVKGTFRWSGTTTLIFTPDKPLPFATHYAVTIDKTAKSVAGNTLDEAVRFTFTTPTIKLLSTEFYRRGGKADGSVLIALRFNQPVTADRILPHVRVRTVGHDLPEPGWTPDGIARVKKLEPQQWAAYEAKKAKFTQIAKTDDAPVLVFAATDWDKERWIPDPTLVVLETKPGVPPETSVNVVLDAKLNRVAGDTETGSEQSYRIDLEPALFVNGIECIQNCDPERHNPILFRANWGNGIRFDAMRKAVTVTDITDPAKEVVLKPKAVKRDAEEDEFPSSAYSLDELGYTLVPAHKYAIRIDPSVTSEDGQKLGYAWMTVVSLTHKSAFVSFGEGHGVWESTGGPLLPFHSRNFKSVTQWLAPFTLEQAMPILQQLKQNGFNTAPPDAKPQKRTIKVATDRIMNLGFDLKPAIGDDNLGLAWAAVQPGEAIANAPIYDENIRATLVQSTNLGISVKDSPLNTLVLVTRLDNAEPVEGAKVSIRTADNKVFWTGTTDAKGFVMAPKTDLRRGKDQPQEQWEVSWRALSDLHFIVTAEKDGDVAYVGSDWHDGVTPWEFGTNYNISEADPLLRGAIFADRGVYKLGEEIHFKLIARSDTPTGMQPLPAGTKIDVAVHDSHSNVIQSVAVPLNAWSSGEWTFKVPADAPLGNYYVNAMWKNQVVFRHDFLVAAYRRPEFRVDVKLTSNSTVAGTKLNGAVSARYLFGGAMPNAPVTWSYTKQLSEDVPPEITNRFPGERWTFLGMDDQEDQSIDRSEIKVQEKETGLNAKGELKVTLDTDKDAGWPYIYRFQGRVTDVTRQEIANRAAFRVDPAPWYIGIANPPYFAEAEKGIDTQIVAAGLDGLAVAGVDVKVVLNRLQWTSVRAAEGDGFYGWDSELKKIPAGQWTIKTAADPVPLHIPLTEGGEYQLVATATDGQGRTTTSRAWFYAIGAGYTAWPRYDHNRIDLIPEKQTYKPGETARIMIKSPWETATALLTTEREGIRTYKPFDLVSTQQTISVPITEKDIPNVFVSVLLVKGRTKQDPGKDGSDPGKPAFRLGYVELNVEDATKRLKVEVKANRDEFRPAAKARIDVDVRDAAGKGSQAEVTLWAVDYGVLSLTDYQTPDILDSIWIRKALQVANEDSRQRIVSRRVLTPKGATDGGGGGADSGPGMMRKDFRVLAFWLGSLVTDKNGKAKADVTLPESLTTYRVMAVAGDRQSRFGWAQNELRINQPVMVTPSWPRFLTPGDTAHFGGVVHNQTKSAGTATVSIKSLNPEVIAVEGEQKVQVPAGGSLEVRWDAIAKSIGTARIQMRVSMGSERDAFEDVIPVRVLVTPETVAAYGEAKPTSQQTLEIPTGVVPGYGGLHMQLSSTMLVGLAEGASYLVQYPYGCAEQRASGALALILTSSLGDAFEIPGIDTAKNKQIAQATIEELRRFECGEGGYSYWPGDCTFVSPYLTSYVMHVLQQGKKHGYKVDEATLNKSYTYLERHVAEPGPANAAWMPSYTAWQSFVVKTLADGGRNVDSHVNRIYDYRDRMPVFAIAWLLDAMQAKGETGARPAELRRRILNSILPEGGNAFVNELADPYLLWFWSSNVRSTAIALGTLVRGGGDEEMVKRMVRWLMAVRKKGRWGNTQENAWAMESIIDYYRKYESEVPDFTAVVAYGQEQLAKETFKGRTTDARAFDFSMTKFTPGASAPVTFTREGTGTLFYMLRLRYGLLPQNLKAIDSGFRVERSYALEGGDGKALTAFKAGDLIRVTLTLRNTKERRFVAVTDPLPAGTEAVETWFATTARELVNSQRQSGSEATWMWWERTGFDHIERHDDRVQMFATRLSEGLHTFSYLVRATTAGTFLTAPAHAEEMYEPEVFGRTGSVTVGVSK